MLAKVNTSSLIIVSGIVNRHNLYYDGRRTYNQIMYVKFIRSVEKLTCGFSKQIYIFYNMAAFMNAKYTEDRIKLRNV